MYSSVFASQVDRLAKAYEAKKLMRDLTHGWAYTSSDAVKAYLDSIIRTGDRAIGSIIWC